MRVLVATDAWHPQVNGVVRTLTSLARSAQALGVSIDFLSPDGFRTVPVPTYPGLRLALPSRGQIARRIEQAKPDAIHIATEGPIGYMVRAYCRRLGRPFTTSYTTRIPEYISARAPIPESWIYAALRRFHAAAAVTMVSTPSLISELGRRGFRNLGMWTRGVDTNLFRPDRPSRSTSRDRSSSRSDGSPSKRTSKDSLRSTCPARRSSSARPAGSGAETPFPERQVPRAAGEWNLGRTSGSGRRLRISEPDGHVRRRAARSACQRRSGRGFPGHRAERCHRRRSGGCVNQDLRVACIEALRISRAACRTFALKYSWESSARQFIGHVQKVATGGHHAPSTGLATAGAQG